MVSMCTRDPVQMLGRAIGHQHTLFVLKLVDGTLRSFDNVIRQRKVFRMNTRPDQVERHGHTGFKLESAIELP